MLGSAITMIDWIYQAEGIFFWPQVLLAAITATHLLVCIEFLWLRPFLFWLREARLVEAIRQRDAESLHQSLPQKLHQDSHDLARVLRHGLVVAEQKASLAELEGELGQACEETELGYERSLTVLNMLAQVNMLVGLLGTVWGLVGTFLEISQSNVAPPPAKLAMGVSQALVTTIWGLFLAIPSLGFYVLLRGSAQRMSFQLFQSVGRAVPLLTAPGASGAPAASSPERA